MAVTELRACARMPTQAHPRVPTHPCPRTPKHTPTHPTHAPTHVTRQANYLDITEQYVGIIAGYGNTLGTLASWAGPQIVGAVLQRTGSWELVLGSVALVNVAASLNYCLHSTVNVVEREAHAAAKKAA